VLQEYRQSDGRAERNKSILDILIKSNFMKNWEKVIRNLLLPALVCISSSLIFATPLPPTSSAVHKTGIRLQHKTKDKQAFIIVGSEVKVKLKELVYRGRLASVSSDSLRIKVKYHSHSVTVALSDILAINNHYKLGRRALGGTLQVIGSITLVAGTAILIDGASYSVNQNGALYLYSIAPAMPSLLWGSGFFFTGRKLRIQRYNLEKKWEIVP
jgi:hypothetical protein